MIDVVTSGLRLTDHQCIPEPVDLTSIQVLGPGHKVLLNLHGSTLAAATKPLIGGKPSATIAASASSTP